MRTVILAGGLGTRLAEETDSRPKPMVEIGGRPILWHILRHYSAYGFRDFVIALGYRGDLVKRYFLDYPLVNGGDLSIHLADNRVTRRDRQTEDWEIHLVDTGSDTNTGGRLKRLADWVGAERFLLTYGDGVADVDLAGLVRFHERTGKLATVTAVRPPARFGGLEFDGDLVTRFTEKPQIGEGWINGGFFVLEPGVLDYIDGDGSSLEKDALRHLAEDGQLAAYRHEAFWQCMDTLRDKRLLEEMWQTGRAPWGIAR